MIKNYFSKNTDPLKSTIPPHPLSSFATPKEKQNKSSSLVAFLGLLLLFFLGAPLAAQTTLFTSGFETGDASLTASTGTNVSITQPYTGASRTGSKSGEMIATGKNLSFTGSIVTSGQISFVSGRYYTVSIWAKAYGDVSTLKIKKSAGNTNTDMNNATGNDLLLNPVSANVTTSSYVQFSVSFQATATENKYVGFQVVSGAQNGSTSALYIDDISIIENTTLPISYCTPTYTSGPGTTDQITNVTLGTLTNTTGTAATPYYTFYNSATVPNLTQSATASVAVTLGSDSAQYVGVWIDFNQDGVFQTSEGAISANAGSNGTVTVNIPIPAGSTLGNTRMRVRGGDDSALNTSQACGNSSSSYGETEDYIVNIISSVACVAPTASASTLTLVPASTAITGTFALPSPVADNYLVVFSTSSTPPSPVNGTTYAVGSTALAGSNVVADTDSNNAFAISGLLASTLYYIYVFPYNTSSCSGGPIYRTTLPLSGSATTLAPTYCTPVGNLNCSSNDYISKIIFNTLNNPTNCGTGGYTNYAATGTQTTSVTKGTTYTLNLSVGSGTGTHAAGVWIDFNQNGDFSDSGEFFLISNSIAANTTTAVAIPIPTGANTGTTRMRVRYAYSATINAASSCTMSGTYGETEDYTVTILNAPACAVPTASATALSLTPTGNAIAGSFTLASPAADNYLVVINTSGTIPVPSNGTNYTIGSTALGGSNVVVDNDSNSTFTALGLLATTTYYVFVFPYSTQCIGGPLYKTTVPLNGNAATIVASNYCKPSITSGYQDNGYISTVSFIGTLNDTSNNSAYSSSPVGYQDFSAFANKAKQAQGEGINMFVQALNTSFMKAWVDWNRDGDFEDSGEMVYDTGGISTYSTTFGFIIPANAAVGDYRVRVRINSRDTKAPFDSNSTPTFTSCLTINYPGETEDYLFTVIASCSSLITSVNDGETCGNGAVNLVAKGAADTTKYRWYTSETGGTYTETSTGSWTTPSLSSTTIYYVTAYNGICESLERTAVTAKISPVPTLTFTPNNPTVCGEETIIALSASGDTQQVYLINENFESGLGVFTNNTITSHTEVNSKTAWQSRTSPFVPAEQVWFPAISSGFGTNKFVMATSDTGSYTIQNALQSSTVNSTNFLDLTLSFKMYYSRYYIDGNNLTQDYATVEVSTNNGSTWTELTRYTADVGYGTRFDTKIFNLNAYINVPNLRVRIRYYGEWCDGVAIDDFKLFGFKPYNTSFNWTSSTPVQAFSDAACTVSYTTGTPIATVYVKPTLAQLETGTYTFTANPVLANGCSASKDITVTNTSKIWKGVTSDWDYASNWSPSGVPTAANCVIIPGTSVIPGSNYLAYAKNLTVKSTGTLEMLTTGTLTVTDFVNVNTGGIFNVRDKASLVQINSVANTGIVTIERTTPPVSQLDYTYWNSPVTAASNFTLGTLSPNTSYMYSWIPTVANGGGDWQYETATTVMDPLKGYIIRAPNSYTSSKVPYTAIFIGTPNNGDLAAPIKKGTLAGVVDVDAENDEWNLIGNPYPSGLDAAKFLNLAANVPVIDGTIYIWTHNSQPNSATPDPFYGDYVFNYTDNDYAVYNTTGGTATGPASTGGSAPTGFIATGQSFFVKAANGMTSGTAAVTFNNSMRVAGKNSDFFKFTTPKTEKKHRIWLNLVNNSGAFSQTLVGYLAGATQDLDRSYDGETLGGNDVTFYSIIPHTQLTIQGRPLPFDENDQVILGYNSAVAGELSIRLDHVDGLFSAQNIYLEDKELNLIHDLKAKPYVFTTEIGDFDDRFVLRYTDKIQMNSVNLATATFELSNAVTVIVNQNVTVKSSGRSIKSIVVYDLSGRKIDQYKKVNAVQFTLHHLNKTTSGLIINITLEDDSIISKKIIY
ncbi:GEVED domain-containing protein [Flavobacterium sp. XS2P39]|uniref:GEVED domain-containing protein n=1 Tax=Flavobacterium sp. XS2P39 TaxID=3401725 RepID=UPI003AAC1BDD